MSDASAPGGASTGRRAQDILALLPLWLAVVLLPVGRAAELAILAGAVLGIVALVRERARLAANPALPLVLAAFAAYWLSTAISAVDAVDPRKAWTETLADLRFLPFALHALLVLERGTRAAMLAWLVAIVVAFWVLDAIAQSVLGTGLGGALSADRVSGLFGADDLKLGPVLGVFGAPLLVEVLHRYGRRATLVVWLVLGAALLVAGARAAWVSHALVTLLMLVRIARGAREGVAYGAILLGAALALGAIGYVASDRVAARVDRTLAALSGDAEGVDHALAYRLPIWRAALAIAADHPVNGVGVRGYRRVYAEYAGPGDHWLDPDHGTGALHPHQIVLEILAETGVIGLALWLAAAAVFVRAWHRASRAARHVAFAPGLALVAMTFPLNTHLAFYSSFWGLVLWFFVAWFAGAIGRREARDG